LIYFALPKSGEEREFIWLDGDDLNEKKNTKNKKHTREKKKKEDEG